MFPLNQKDSNQCVAEKRSYPTRDRATENKDECSVPVKAVATVKKRTQSVGTEMMCEVYPKEYGIQQGVASSSLIHAPKTT